MKIGELKRLIEKIPDDHAVGFASLMYGTWLEELRTDQLDWKPLEGQLLIRAPYQDEGDGS